MLKTLCLASLAPLALTACTEPATTTPTPLSQLHGASLQLQTNNDSPMIDAGYTAPTMLEITAPGCPRLRDDATATIDGVPMNVLTRGGPWNDFEGAGCDDISFDIDGVTPRATSTIVISDATATWTIEGTALFSNDITLVTRPVAGGTAELVWKSAATIDGVYAQFTQGESLMFTTFVAGPPVYTTQGNRVVLDVPAGVAGSGTLSLNLARSAQATRCDGPASCTLTVSAGVDIATTIGTSALRDRGAAIATALR